MQDKQIKCRIAGCENTWTWFAAQQIRGFGQPPPDRMCDEHLGQFNELSDREVPCRTPGCPNTWTWKRGAQLAELQRTGKLRRPSRLCAECFSAERETHDVELPCKVDGCKRSWTWTRDAQLRHRLWVLRQRAKADAAANRATRPPRDAAPQRESVAPELVEARPVDTLAVTVERPLPFLGDLPAPTGPEGHVPEASPESSPEVEAEAASDAGAEASESGDAGSESEGNEPGGERRKRRRKRRRGGKPLPNPEGPPERMCGLCAQKLSRVQPKEQPCKVHGCSRTWTWDRASQMRAWVLSGSDDVEFEPPAPKRMCEVCREFCRTHPDREVPCGRPGCANTWTFKTGAQLQAFLAGRTADPLKLCGECAKGEFAASFRPGAEGGAVPEGAETMPCVVPGCEGTWLYIPGMRLRDTAYGELSPDRMCDRHREERGFAAATLPEPQEVEVTAADLAADEPASDDAGEHDHDHDHDEPEPGDEPGDDLRDADDLPEVADAPEGSDETDDGSTAVPDPESVA